MSSDLKELYVRCPCHQDNLGHHFNDNLICEHGCGVSWKEHQRSPMTCFAAREIEERRLAARSVAEVARDVRKAEKESAARKQASRDLARERWRDWKRRKLLTANRRRVSSVAESLEAGA